MSNGNVSQSPERIRRLLHIKHVPDLEPVVNWCDVICHSRVFLQRFSVQPAHFLGIFNHHLLYVIRVNDKTGNFSVRLFGSCNFVLSADVAVVAVREYFFYRQSLFTTVHVFDGYFHVFIKDCELFKNKLYLSAFKGEGGLEEAFFSFTLFNLCLLSI